jgi:hypothetical protein
MGAHRLDILNDLVLFNNKKALFVSWKNGVSAEIY